METRSRAKAVRGLRPLKVSLSAWRVGQTPLAKGPVPLAAFEERPGQPTLSCKQGHFLKVNPSSTQMRDCADPGMSVEKKLLDIPNPL